MPITIIWKRLSDKRTIKTNFYDMLNQAKMQILSDYG